MPLRRLRGLEEILAQKMPTQHFILRLYCFFLCFVEVTQDVHDLTCMKSQSPAALM